MKYFKEILLKNGKICILREASGTDAAAVLECLIQTSAETENMARYADEITMTVEEERVYLETLKENPRGILILAFVDGELAGSAGIGVVSPFEKYRHRAGFGVSIKKTFWGVGIGTALTEAAIEAAGMAEFEQIELEVVSDNEPAVRLYKKCGFECYGTCEKSFWYRDGRYGTQYLMKRGL